MRRLLTAWGFQEAVNFSFTREELLDKLRLPANDPRRRVLRIRNPLGGEAALRSFLLPSLLENLMLNESRGSREEKLFEIARVFRPQPGVPTPVEVRTVALVAAGDRLPAWWGSKGEGVDFYDLKGIVEALAKMGGAPLTFRAASDIPYLHPGQQAEVVLEGDAVGSIGALHPEVIRNFDLRTAAFAMEIDLDRLDRDRKPRVRYSPLPRYPAVFRDMAVVVPERMRAAEVEGAIRRAGGALVEAVRPFDVYRGDPVPHGKKSLAFSIQYRAADRTLTDEEVATIHGRILEAVERDLGGVLR
jgi:phenylalanyl-tRNA synthetase beta chain